MMPEREKEILERLAKAVIDTDEGAVRKTAEDAIEAKLDLVSAITDGLAKGMEVIGEKFGKSEIFLPQVILAADAMKAGIAVLRPHIAAEKRAEMMRGKVVIGTVYGDMHDLGKNLVAAMLEVDGFEVYDIGAECPPIKFIEKSKEVGADIIAMSSLMTTTMFYQKDVIDYLKEMGLRDEYRVMVGGGPIPPEWAKEIGADGWGKTAKNAVEVARMFMERGKGVDMVERPIIRD